MAGVTLSSFALPEAAVVAALIRSLIGKPVKVRLSKPAPLDLFSGAPMFVGVFVVDGNNDPSAALILDAKLAIITSGLLSGTPPRQLHDYLQNGSVSEAVQETIHEVLNIMGSLLNVRGKPHLRLRSVEELSGSPKDLLASVLTGERRDLEVTIESFSPGRLAFVRSR